MYVNAKTGALGGGGTYGGTLAAGDGSTNDTAAIQAMIDACPADKYVYLPASTYRLNSALSFTASTAEMTLKGDGQTTILDSRASTAINIGPTNGFVVVGSAADLVISAGLSKASTQLTIGSTANLTVGDLVQIQIDIDTSLPDVSVSGFRYIKRQVVKVATIPNGTQFTFFPELYSAYGSGSYAARIRVAADKISRIGIEDMKIILTNASDGQQAISMNQAFGCWIKGIRATDVKNYPFAIRDSLQCEVRRNIVDPRAGSGTSGAGVYFSQSSAVLYEDNFTVGEWIFSGEIDNGSSNIVVSRNYADTSGGFDMNHGSGTQFNLAEGNSFTFILSDGYFGSDSYTMAFNNKAASFSNHRFVRNNSMVGNYFTTNSYAGGSGDVTGLPNFANTSSTGTSTYYSGSYADPWVDYGITGSRATFTAGTAAGWTVSGAHAQGVSTITLTGGTGTMGLGDKVTFSGSSYSYWVQSFSAGTLVINEGETVNLGYTGLKEAISNGATVTLSSIAPGTASGYLVNNGAGYPDGTTAITVDTGTGTMNAGDVVLFSGNGFRYTVVSLSGATLTIGSSSAGTTGLVGAIADNATVTLSQDRGLISYTPSTATGIRSFNGFYTIYPVLNWGTGGETYSRYRVPVANSTQFVVINDQPTYANTTALPSIGTTISAIGPGSEAFQEQDLAVELTMLRKGNRYSDGTFDSLGGDTLPSSLIYGETVPQWILDARAEYPLATFNLRPYDPITPTPPSDSDIPAGYRYSYSLEPAVSSASINAAGTQLSIGFNKPLYVGAGGAVNATLSGGVTCTYASISGSTIIFTPSRTISEGESLTVTLTNVANGFEDANGNDAPNLSGYTVSNSSSSTSGVVHYGPDEVDMTSDSINPWSTRTLLQKALVESSGTATHIRFYIAGNTYDAAMRVTLCSASGTVLGSGTGTVTGVDRWHSVSITSAPVTGNTTYLATVQFLGNDDPTLRALTGQAANSSYFDDTVAYGAALPSQFTSLTGSTTKFAIQVRVIPDPPIYTPGRLRMLRR